MFQSFRNGKFLLVIYMVILMLGVKTFGQSQWLDQTPVPGWNERKRTILATRRIRAAELKRCAVAVRQPALAQDFQLTRGGSPTRGFSKVSTAHAAFSFAAARFSWTCSPIPARCASLKPTADSEPPNG